MTRQPTVDAEPWNPTLHELCRLAGVPPEWVIERVRGGLIQPAGAEPLAPGESAHDEPAAWRFDAITLRQTRSMRRIELTFEASPELAALVADLEAEIARLRGLLAARP